MTQTLEAVFEDGVLKPVGRLTGIPEHARVKLTLESEPVRTGRLPIMDCFGVMPDEDAAEMRKIIEDEFETVDPRDWE